MRKTNGMRWLGVLLAAVLVVSGWAQEERRRDGDGGRGRDGGGRGEGGDWMRATVLSVDAQGGKVSLLTTSTRAREGVHPAALDEAAKVLRAKADATTDAAEAGTLRAAAKILDTTRGQTTTASVPTEAVINTVKVSTAKEIQAESRIQFNGEFEEGLAEGEVPQTVTLSRLGEQPPMIWTAPREAQAGFRRWGQSNRGTFVGFVTSVSPLVVDIGNGKMATVNLPKDGEVRYLQSKAAQLDGLKAGMFATAYVANDNGARSVRRIYASESDLESLNFGFLFGGGRGGPGDGPPGGGDRGGERRGR